MNRRTQLFALVGLVMLLAACGGSGSEDARRLPDIGLERLGQDGSYPVAGPGNERVLNLWATWCAPCREEMPALDELQAALGGDTFEVIAVNIDQGSDEKPKNFLSEIGVSNLGFYRDNTMGIFNTLKKEGYAFGLPVTLLVDGNGCLLANMNGPAHWSGDDAKAYISKALTEQSG